MCAKDLDDCHENAKCLKTGPGKYSCACNKGYEGDGKSCTEINECISNPEVCSIHAICMHAGPGKHTCTCRPGYGGNGEVCTKIGGDGLDCLDGCASKKLSEAADVVAKALDTVVANERAKAPLPISKDSQNGTCLCVFMNHTHVFVHVSV